MDDYYWVLTTDFLNILWKCIRQSLVLKYQSTLNELKLALQSNWNQKNLKLTGIVCQESRQFMVKSCAHLCHWCHSHWWLWWIYKEQKTRAVEQGICSNATVTLYLLCLTLVSWHEVIICRTLCYSNGADDNSITARNGHSIQKSE